MAAITWTSLTNASIDGDGDLEKDAGANECYTNASGTGDGGAKSTETVTSGDWAFECTLGPDPSGRTFVGVQHGTFSLDYANWDYCIHVSTELNTSSTPHPVDSIFIYEGGGANKTYRDGIWNEGDILRIECLNGVVRYYCNCLLLYTSSQAPTYPLYFVASLACLSRTVVDAAYYTGGAALGTFVSERGGTTGTGCTAPWTFPTPTALPFTPGSTRYTYFDEIEGDWGEHGQKFPDGNPAHNTIQTAAVRRFIVEWDGLSAADAATLDAHYDSTSGGAKFTMVHPRTAESISGCRYESYERTEHVKYWAQKRTAKIVKYTN